MSSILLGNDTVDCCAKAAGDAFGRVWVFYNAYDQGYYGKKAVVSMCLSKFRTIDFYKSHLALL